MNILPELLTGQLHLIVAYRGAGTALTDLITHLALRGRLQVLDGGNRFHLHLCGRSLAQSLYSVPEPERVSLPKVLERIQVARAFTCYQVLSLLAQAPARPFPTLVLDLLSTFYDESVPGPEARRLLTTCAGHLRRLCAQAPVVVSVAPLPAKAPEQRAVYLKILEAAVDQIWVQEDPNPPKRSRQPRLPNI